MAVYAVHGTAPYAGLNTVDQSQIDAAQVDGAGPWMLLLRITYRPFGLAILSVLAIKGDGCVPVLRPDLRSDGRGTGNATETVMIYTYQLAFRLLQIGSFGAGGDHAADYRGGDRGDHRGAISARTGWILMWCGWCGI